MKALRPAFLFVFFLILFLLNTFFVFETGWMPEIDRRVYGLFEVLKSSEWLRVSHIVTFFGNGNTLYLLGGVVIGWLLMVRSCSPSTLSERRPSGRRVEGLIHRRFGRTGWYFVVLALGFELNALLKLYFARPRPVGYDHSYVPTTYAYPSGHAFDSLVFYFLTFVIFSQKMGSKTKRAASVILVCLTTAIGLSRLALGVHWLSDVTGGLLLGAAWLFLNLSLVQKLKEP